MTGRSQESWGNDVLHQILDSRTMEHPGVDRTKASTIWMGKERIPRTSAVHTSVSWRAALLERVRLYPSCTPFRKLSAGNAGDKDTPSSGVDEIVSESEVQSREDPDDRRGKRRNMREETVSRGRKTKKQGRGCTPSLGAASTSRLCCIPLRRRSSKVSVQRTISTSLSVRKENRPLPRRSLYGWP